MNLEKLIDKKVFDMVDPGEYDVINDWLEIAKNEFDEEFFNENVKIISELIKGYRLQVGTPESFFSAHLTSIYDNGGDKEDIKYLVDFCSHIIDEKKDCEYATKIFNLANSIILFVGPEYVSKVIRITVEDYNHNSDLSYDILNTVINGLNSPLMSKKDKIDLLKVIELNKEDEKNTMEALNRMMTYTRTGRAHIRGKLY